jgi:hypothetical protein
MALAASAALAHHTFVNKYDSSKPVSASGTVTSVSWGNPHIYFTVGGWTVETEGISVLTSRGITREKLDGAKVTVRGWKARDGSSTMGMRSISIHGGPSATTRGSTR